jgi:YfiH family protein
MEWRSADGVEWLEASLGDGARAAFSTRSGGVSSGPFASLNLGLLTGDERGSVLENRRRLGQALGRPPEGVLFGHQVHGAGIAVRARPDAAFLDPGEALPKVDGQVAERPGLTALVLVADCLPVALAGPRGTAMLHCGWRGLAAGIVGRGVEATGAGHAAIGPGVGPCCYEVGEEVLDAFSSLGDGVAQGRMLDLPEVARRALARAGVEAVESSRLCTSCEEERFFSHRRDGPATGRQAGMAWAEGRAG